MPTTYAHDLFGQKVYRQLPDQVKEIIRKNGELYRIGLHGPDIFFYYFINNRYFQINVFYMKSFQHIFCIDYSSHHKWKFIFFHGYLIINIKIHIAMNRSFYC